MSSLQEPCFPQQILFHSAVRWVVLGTVWEMDQRECELCRTEQSLGRQLWLVHPLWCGSTNSTRPGTEQAGSEDAVSRTQPTAWCRSFLPQFLLLLLAAQMVSPAVKGTSTAFQRKQRESILGVDHKCWSCYSPVICQQRIVGVDMLKVGLDDIGCLTNLSDSVMGTHITVPYFKIPMTCPKFIQPHFQPRYLQPRLTTISGNFFFFFLIGKTHSFHYFTENVQLLRIVSKRGWSATGQVTALSEIVYVGSEKCYVGKSDFGNHIFDTSIWLEHAV